MGLVPPGARVVLRMALATEQLKGAAALDLRVVPKELPGRFLNVQWI